MIGSSRGAILERTPTPRLSPLLIAFKRIAGIQSSLWVAEDPPDCIKIARWGKEMYWSEHAGTE